MPEPLTNLEVLKLRLRKLKGTDQQLAIEIFAVIETAIAEGGLTDPRSKQSYAQRPSPAIRSDILTSSIDEVLRLLQWLFPNAAWALFYNEFCLGLTGQKIDPDGPYAIQIDTPDALYCGSGWTPATCVFDGILRTLQGTDDLRPRPPEEA